MRPISHILAVLPILSVLAAGCGSSEGEAAPTRAEFIKEADAICIRTDAIVLRKVKELAKAHPAWASDLSKKSAGSEVITLITAPEIKKEAEGLASLTPPDGDGKMMSRYVAEIETGVREIERDPTRFTNDFGAFRRVNEVGTKYGFKSCNEPL